MRENKQFLRVLGISVLIFILTFPLSAGAEQNEISILEGEFVSDSGLSAKYSELTAEFMNSLSEYEMQRFREQVARDYVAQFPDAVLEIEATAEEMKELEQERAAVFKKAFSQPLQVVAGTAASAALPIHEEQLPAAVEEGKVPFPVEGPVTVTLQRVTDNGVAVEPVALTPEIISGLNAAELQQLQDRIIADIVEHHEEQIKTVRYSDEIQGVLAARKEAAYQHAFSYPLSIDPQAAFTTIDIGSDSDRRESAVPLMLDTANAGLAMTFGDENRVCARAAWETGSRAGADAQSECVKMGESASAAALSLVGTVVSITGSGSREAEIVVRGAYEAILQVLGTHYGSSQAADTYAEAVAAVDVLICEFDPLTNTIGPCIAQANAFTPVVFGTIMPNQFRDNIKATFKVNLTAGKSYIAAAGVFTEALASAPAGVAFALADMYSEPEGGYGAAGLDFHSVEFNWR